MKLKTVILSLFLLLGTSVFAGNSDICIFFPDGEERGGLYYLTGQDNPFTGTSKCVYSDTGQIEYLGEIRNGKLEGVWTWWYKNTQKEKEGNYKDGKLNGKWTSWYPIGIIKVEVIYKDGECISGDCP